jgi:hypothetical protein
MRDKPRVASKLVKNAGLQESVRQFATNINPKSATVSPDGKTMELTCTLDLPLVVLADMPAFMQKTVMKDITPTMMQHIPTPLLMNFVSTGLVSFSDLPIHVLREIPVERLEGEGIDDATLREILGGMKHSDNLGEYGELYDVLYDVTEDEVTKFITAHNIVSPSSAVVGSDWGGAENPLTIEIKNGKANIRFDFLGELINGKLGTGAKEFGSFGSDPIFTPKQWKKVIPLVQSKGWKWSMSGKDFSLDWQPQPVELVGYEFSMGAFAFTYTVDVPLSKFDRDGLILLLRFFQGDKSILS